MYRRLSIYIHYKFERNNKFIKCEKQYTYYTLLLRIEIFLNIGIYFYNKSIIVIYRFILLVGLKYEVIPKQIK